MSLKHAYSLAHTAQCRLQMEVGRRDRNLRFIVGHLMHYESLRLRIVEIEHDVSKSGEDSAVSFKGTGHVSNNNRSTPTAGRHGRKSPPPPATKSHEDGDDRTDSSDSEDHSDDLMDDEEVHELGLTRFPSGSSQPARAPPDLEPDDPKHDEIDDDEEPTSPEEMDDATIKTYIHGDGDEKLLKLYDGVRRCSCHGQKESAPVLERIWKVPGTLPGDNGLPIKRAIAQVT